MKNILITGGSGFIGSHLVRLMLNKYPCFQIINVDSLSYAGNPDNLSAFEDFSNYHFEKGDICNEDRMKEIFSQYGINHVIHLAAESHVDRSITDPLSFIRVNVLGTANLLHIAKEFWVREYDNKLFYHVSTDEVFGSLGDEGFFTEGTAYDPRSPYSASKASSDHFFRAFYHTYNLPVILSNCSNNYGPNQFPEKLIPLFINNIIKEKKLPVYGNDRSHPFTYKINRSKTRA